MPKNKKRLKEQWIIAIFASLLFIVFQNFTTPLGLEINEKYIGIEKTSVDGEYRFVFEGKKAKSILNSLKDTTPIELQKPVLNDKGTSSITNDFAIFQGEQISCGYPKAKPDDVFCWTILGKNGSFRVDANFPAFKPIKFLQAKVDGELIDLRIENSFFVENNIHKLQAGESRKSKGIRCSEDIFPATFNCHLNLSSSGEIRSLVF